MQPVTQINTMSEEAPTRKWGERFDAETQTWVSAEGYEVCQDHTGPRQTCPYKHGNRRA